MKLTTITIFYPSFFFLAHHHHNCHGLSFEHSVKNFRPVIPSSTTSPFYRSASLDELSLSDARSLLDGSAFASSSSSSSSENKPLAAVIDLRNKDEIQKGKLKRTEGSQLFYSSLLSSSYPPSSFELSQSNDQPMLYHAPLLQNINAFWDEAINRMDTSARIKATLQTIYSGGALDRAAAKHLEEQGLSELYTIMMSSNGREIKRALDICAAHAAVVPAADDCDGKSNDLVLSTAGGLILFHCQKGKDRTGVLSMLLQYACNTNLSEEEIIQLYSLSGDLLGGEDASSSSRTNSKKEGSSGTMLDWSKFRGSPSSAMKETIQWINDTYGSVEKYMDYIDFGAEERRELRESIERMSNLRERTIELS